jgi:uncharacterized protein YegP (UPF0339 family)
LKNTKLKPGIHLHKSYNWKPIKKGTGYQGKTEWYWNIVSKNGRIIARSSETYTRKGNAKKSILVAAEIFLGGKPYELIPYYDHSKPDLELKSYL